MVDGGFQQCAKGQAKYCQSHRHPTTSLWRNNCLSFTEKCIAVGASRLNKKLNVPPKETTAYTESPWERNESVLCMYL